MNINDCFNENYPNVETLTITSSYTGMTTTKIKENLHTIFNITTSTGVLTKGMIPDYIKHVNIRDNYELQIEPGILPSKLIKFDMGFQYNIKITKDWLPHNLIYLKISNNYDHEFDKNTFPPNLIYLIFPYRYTHIINSKYLPNSIKFLDFPSCVTPYRLPINVTHLYSRHGFASNFKDSSFEHLILPPNLYLISFFDANCIFPNNFFPKTLKVMKFTSNNGTSYDKILNNIPSTVEILIFEHVNFQLANLPTTIQKIKIIYPYYSLDKINYCFPKIPFGYKIVNKNNLIIIE